MLTKKIDDNYYLFQCPKCGGIARIDREQAEGKVSIMHDEKSNPEKCDYHETKNWLERSENCPDCGRLWGIKNVKKGVWFYCTKCKKWKFDKPTERK